MSIRRLISKPMKFGVIFVFFAVLSLVRNSGVTSTFAMNTQRQSPPAEEKLITPRDNLGIPSDVAEYQLNDNYSSDSGQNFFSINLDAENAEIINTSFPLAIPSGFFQIRSDIGVSLYKKDYVGGQPDFVQVADLDQGAQVKFLHGSIADLGVGQGSFGGNNATFWKTSLLTAWNDFAGANDHAFCITNGQFFSTLADPTPLAFPLKKDGQILSDGYGSDNEFPGQLLILEIWNDHADIRPLTKDNLYGSSAPDILGGLTEDANKGITNYVGRTFAGIDDTDGDGDYEMIYIFTSSYARQTTAATVLRNFGADKVIMFDGGGSTQMRCGSTSYIYSSRSIPQTIGVIAGGPRDTTPPTTTLNLPGIGLGENGWYTSAISFSLSATDNSSGISYSEFSVDSSGWIRYSNEFTLSINGQHSIYYRSVDKAGNVESPKSATVNIDTELPLNPGFIDPGCDAESGVPQSKCNQPYFYWYGQSDSISGVAGFEVYWGADPEGTTGIWKEISFLFPPTVSGGVYYLRLRTKDLAGNFSAWETLFILNYNSQILNPLPYSLYLPLTMNIDSACLVAPTLLAPVDQSYLNTLIPLYRFDQGNSPDTEGFEYEISLYNDFSETYSSGNWTGPSSGVFEFRQLFNLPSHTTFFWRVRNDCGYSMSPYSETWSFTTGTDGVILQTPTLSSPLNGNHVSELNPTLEWVGVEAAVEYSLGLKELEESWYYVLGSVEPRFELWALTPNTTYEWWVTMRNDYAWSESSDHWQFTTPAETLVNLQSNYQKSILIIREEGRIIELFN